MTSEVVVMNRLGIALASDSAATVYVGDRTKFYHADKLFMLSECAPVGVMVYNNSSLLGVPWETIIKMFRAKLGVKRFDTLEEYSAHLIEYLQNNEVLFPPEAQQRYFLLLVRTLFSGLKKGIQRQLIRKQIDGEAIDNSQINNIYLSVINESLEAWRGEADAAEECFPKDLGSKVVGQVSGDINNLIVEFFPVATHEIAPHLYDLVKMVISKEKILDESLSGLVIAGFGEKQYFPVTQQFELGEIFISKLKYRCISTEKIDINTPSVIKPFAQSEMVQTFLNGISPAYEIHLIRELVADMLKSPQEIIDGMPGVSKKRKEEYKEKVLPISVTAVEDLVGRLRAFKSEKQLYPILQSIEFLPKNELAHVAASLVNLSSFQKRMSISEDETVGGPIDVAVISKGDGFVWIDRKHYFKPELNRHFFNNRNKVQLINGENND